MRVAVVDLGTNTTRVLVADVDDGRVDELDRRTTVTRLGEGVDATGRLSDAAIERVTDALADYREAIDALGAERDGRASPPAPCATPTTATSSATSFAATASASTPASSPATRRRG